MIFESKLGGLWRGGEDVVSDDEIKETNRVLTLLFVGERANSVRYIQRLVMVSYRGYDMILSMMLPKKNIYRVFDSVCVHTIGRFKDI